MLAKNLQVLADSHKKPGSVSIEYTYAIGVIPDDHDPWQQAYFYNAYNFFNKLERDGLISNLKFSRAEPQQDDIPYPHDIFQAHFAYKPKPLSKRIAGVVEKLTEASLRKKKLRGDSTSLNFGVNGLTYKESSIALRTKELRAFAKELFDGREEYEGTNVIREGKSVSASKFRAKYKLTKRQFADKLKYIRSQLETKFESEPLKIFITNVNAGNGEYMMKVMYGE